MGGTLLSTVYMHVPPASIFGPGLLCWKRAVNQGWYFACGVSNDVVPTHRLPFGC